MITTSSSPNGAYQTNVDISELWLAAVDRYEQNTKTKLNSLPAVTSVDDILNALEGKGNGFKTHRNDSSVLDRSRKVLAKIMRRIDTVSELAAQPSVNVSHAAVSLHSLFCDHE